MAVKVDSIEEAAYIAGQAAENTRLKEENARLRAIISAPVERFGTPELVSWANRLWEILSEYPEEDRGSAAFVFTMGAHLEKFAKAWNSPTIAAKDARIAELEAALVEAIAQLRYYKDALPINRSMLCDTPEEFQAELREKAHAALQQTGSQAAHSVVIRSEVMWFAEQMERKLRANDHKGGWRNDYIRHLNYRLGLEQVELNVALTKGIAEEIISEAADVANFAMMVADLAHDPPKNSLHEYIRSQAAPEEGEDGN